MACPSPFSPALFPRLSLLTRPKASLSLAQLSAPPMQLSALLPLPPDCLCPWSLFYITKLAAAAAAAAATAAL